MTPVVPPSFEPQPEDLSEVGPRQRTIMSPPPGEEQFQEEFAGQVEQQIAPAMSPQQPSTDLEAYRQQMKELNEALQAQRELTEDLKFQLEMFTPGGQQPAGYGYGPSMPYFGGASLPPNLDPDATITLKDLAVVAKNLLAQAEVSAIRNTWDITSSEEQQAFQRMPALQAIEDPVKQLKAVKEIVVRMRKQAKGSNPQSAPAAAAPTQTTSGRQAPQVVVRPIQQTVPATEAGGGAGAATAEPTPTNLYLQYMREYEEAKSERNLRLRRQKMRTAIEKISKLQGVRTYGDLFDGSFSQGRTRKF